MARIRVQKDEEEQEFTLEQLLNPHDIATHILVKRPSTRFGTIPLLGSVFTMNERIGLVVPRQAWSVDPKIVDLLRPWLEV